MKHIHPFPARMAPDIALSRLDALPKKAIVLDPMCGSGMVLSQSARAGVFSIGCDLDPLARLMSRVGSTRVSESAVWGCFDQLRAYCKRNERTTARLPWIDKHAETSEFVRYWFGHEQEKQLRRIAKFFAQHNHNLSSNPRNVIKIALSRLIVSKEPKASLARDTAHSRPHRTIDENDFDVYENLESSVHHVLDALAASEIKVNSKTYLSDARRLARVPDASIDAIITSPPYLNAIDYMRGHKFSLIWFGYDLGSLRELRSVAIGSEASLRSAEHFEFNELLDVLRLADLAGRTRSMINRYYVDLRRQMVESKRVLKRRRLALFVIGNSSIRGDYIKNSEVLKFAAVKAGFAVRGEEVREIPNNKRYLPVTVKGPNALASRMRTEHVIELVA